MNRLTRVKSPVGNETSFAYTCFEYDSRGNRTKVTDPLSKVTSFGFDLEDRLTTVTDALAGQTFYGYDFWDNLIKVTDARDKVTEYEYDSLGRLTREVGEYSDLGVTKFGWEYLYANTLGSQLTKVRKPNTIVSSAPTFLETAFKYDAMERVTAIGHVDLGTTVTFTYDVNSQLVRGRDELNGMSVGTGTVNDWFFEYDKGGALTRERLAVVDSQTTYSLGDRKIEFDKAGRRTKHSFKSDNRTGYLNLDTATSYSYDSSKHWLNAIRRIGSTTDKANYEYDPSDGRLTKIAFGNGTRSEYAYYASGALSKISHFANGGTLFASVAYEYDLAGNVTRTVLDDNLANPGDATVTYQYDDLHRLTREYCKPVPNGSDRKEYGYKYWYDAVGNRTQMSYYDGSTTITTTYQYSPRNELTKVNSESGGYLLTYDLRGNLTAKGATEYYWSSDDKLTKVVDGSKTVEYKYDLLGRRIAKKVDAGPWRWYFFDGLQVIAEGTGQDNKISYTNTGAAIGGIITRGDSATTYTYHFDRLGNVMAVTDSSGSPYALYTMEAFGNVLEKGTSTGYSSEHATDPQPYHLTTKEYDPDVGLYYFSARWYDATIGKFTSRGRLPVVFEHPYIFCNNNPVRYADPSGQCPEREECLFNDKNKNWCESNLLSGRLCQKENKDPGAQCYREVKLWPGYGEHCCYDSQGNLIKTGTFAPHRDFVDPALFEIPFHKKGRPGPCFMLEPLRLCGHFIFDNWPCHLAEYECQGGPIIPPLIDPPFYPWIHEGYLKL